MQKFFFVATILFYSFTAFAQQPVPEALNSNTKEHFRGLSVVTDKVVWVSGTNGTVGKSIDSGKTWQWFQVKGMEKTDFRDIEAFDEHTAVIMGIASPGYILKTTDGGKTWKTVYENKHADIFMDAMSFYGEKHGIVVGDAIDGKAFIARTMDGGNSWIEEGLNNRPKIDSGEAFYAASGANIQLLNNNDYLLVSGGKVARLFTSNLFISLPLLQGGSMTGPNAVVYWPEKEKPVNIAVVGGDYDKQNDTTGNFVFSTDGGETWQKPTVPPAGYRSGLTYYKNNILFSCGIPGVDYSTDGGKNWTLIGKEGYHVIQRAKKGDAIFLAGANGKIARIIWQ